MRIALHQGPSPAGDIEAGFAVIARSLAAARAAGADLALFPELYLPGYNHDRIPELAQPAGGAWEVRLAGLAREAGVALVIGLAEREGAVLRNAALAFGPGGALLARYHKVQLFGPREQALFAPGDRLCRFDLGGLRCGLMICYDVEFAAHVRALAEAGAELLLVPTANPEPFHHVSRATVPSQAANHGLTVAYANLCGPEGSIAYCGGSLIAAPDGTALAFAGPGEALLIADLAPARAVPQAIRSTQLADFRAVPVGG